MDWHPLLQGHAELTRKEFEELIHPAIAASGRLSAGKLEHGGARVDSWCIACRQHETCLCTLSSTALPLLPCPSHPADEAEQSLRSIQHDPTDSHLARCLFRRFLQRRLPEVAAAGGGGSGQ